MPKFSVIVPIYNVEKYLKKCIDSILTQSFSDFELILVDDGSPDNCPEICDEYAKTDERIKVVHKKNGGLSSARNAGLLQVQGEYIWFVDSDDCVRNDALEVIEKYTVTGADIINFGWVGYNEGGEPDFDSLKMRFSYFKGLADKKDICTLATRACSTRLLSYVWRNVYRTAFVKENGLSFEENLCYAEDSAFNMEAFLQAEKIYFAQEFLYAYCQRANSISKNREKKFDLAVLGHFSLYDKLRDECYEKYCSCRDDEYYKDAGTFVIKTLYIYALLNRLYQSDSRNNYGLFKKISESEMIRKAFSRFDLNEHKSKSLDWWMLYFVKNKLYFLGFLIYRFFIF